MRLRYFVSLFCIAGTLRCKAQTSTKETQEKIDRVRASDARNAAVTNTPGTSVVTRGEVDDLARKLEAGFGTRPKTERVKSEMELNLAREQWAEQSKLEAAAKAGNPAANLSIANQYFYGGGSAQFVDHAKALRYYLVAAEKRDDALFISGRMIYQGDATLADEERGRRMMEAAATGGNADAKAFLASHPRVARTEHFPNMLTRMPQPAMSGPMTVKRDKYEKRVWALMDGKAKDPTNSDYASAADFYSRGIGAPQDAQKAYDFALKARAGYLADFEQAAAYGPILKWAMLHMKEDPAGFAKAAAQYAAYRGMDSSYYQAAAACLLGDPAKERYYLGLAANPQANSPQSYPTPMARVDLGLMQIAGEGGPVDEASGIQNLLAYSHSPEAQYYLSRFAASGTHGQKKDPAAARSLLEAAAKGGQADAIRELAAMNQAGNVGR